VIQTALATGLADLRAEELGRTERRLALLALDRERRGDQRAALGAAVAERPLALRAHAGELLLVLLEEPEREPAAQAKGDPVAEGLPALLLNPVPFGLRHPSRLAPK